MDEYRSVAKPEVKRGDTVLFWSDEWNFEGSRTPLRDRFSRLFSFAKNSKISVRNMVSLQDRTVEFHLPLSVRAYDELVQLEGCLDQLILEDSDKDVWKCSWGIIQRLSTMPPSILTFRSVHFISEFGRANAQ